MYFQYIWHVDQDKTMSLVQTLGVWHILKDVLHNHPRFIFTPYAGQDVVKAGP